MASASAPAQVQPSDADFLAARTAFERGQRDRLEALAPQLQGHLLQPYVDYWRLRLGLDTATDDEVRAFLDANVVPPLTQQLRVDWLKSLARRGQWSRFAVDYPPPAGEDSELACYGIQYRRQRDGDAALAAAKPLWFNGQALPEACDPLFDALIARGSLTVADRRERFRLATQAGNVRLARLIAGDLPAGERISAAEFAPVDKDPARSLASGNFRWRQPGGARARALRARTRRPQRCGAGAPGVGKAARAAAGSRAPLLATRASPPPRGAAVATRGARLVSEAGEQPLGRGRACLAGARGAAGRVVERRAGGDRRHARGPGGRNRVALLARPGAGRAGPGDRGRRALRGAGRRGRLYPLLAADAQGRGPRRCASCGRRRSRPIRSGWWPWRPCRRQAGVEAGATRPAARDAARVGADRPRRR
ncbi:MAG: hypothetical protein IPO82_18085 [Betaproteobacteria bacterium]|nr:hypothetical protein [Betaproteobacteria bacterium]